MKSDIMYDRLEKMRGVALTEEEKYEIDMWGRGRALAQIVVTEGYQEVLNILQSYAGDAVERSMLIVPGDNEEILAQHAVAFTATKIYSNFISDVAKAVEASRTTPEVVKLGFKSGPVPVESN